MSKKLSTTELNTIAEYITDTLYNEKKVEAVKKLNCMSEEEYSTFKEKMKDFGEYVDSQCKEMEELIAGRYYMGKKLRICWSIPSLYGEKVYNSDLTDLPDYSDIHKKVMTKLVITNLSDAVDVDKLMSELRKTI